MAKDITKLPPHQIDALRRGESAWFGGDQYLPSDLPTVEQLLAQRNSGSGRDVVPTVGDVKQSPEYLALREDAGREVAAANTAANDARTKQKEAVDALRKDAALFLPAKKEDIEALDQERLSALVRLKGVKPPKDAKREDVIKLLLKETA